MYLDMGNMMSYNKSHGCEQPYLTCTLIPIPPEFELYIYLILSALVPVSAQMILPMAFNVLSYSILVCHDKGEKFSGQTGPRDVEIMKSVTSTSSPPQDL